MGPPPKESDVNAYPEWLQASWQRCSLQSAPTPWQPPHLARGQTLQSMLQRKRDLVVTGEMALEDLYEYMEGRRCALLLTDESGCLLARVGHGEILAALGELGLLQGAFLSEGRLGSNAINLAGHLGMPLTLRGKEHFKEALHGWVGSATPVFNPQGRLVAMLALYCPLEEAYPGDLALAVAAGRELANLLQMEGLMQESQRHLSELYALLEGMDDGVLAWDHQARIRYLNRLAAERLGLDPARVLGQPLALHLRLPRRLELAIESEDPLSHVDLVLECEGRLLPVLLSLKRVPTPLGAHFIALLHPAERLEALWLRRQPPPMLVADSRPMARTLRLARQAAHGNGPVLLRGEPGSGKGTLAAYLHLEGSQADGPLVIVDCHAIPPARLESLLMGCDEEGIERPGKMEEAHGGTLVLEQVEQLPPTLQGALLQWLKSGRLQRFDSSRVLLPKFRLIATSSVDLEVRVAQGLFGRQLLFALQAFELWLPPLRERTADLPRLIAHQLELQGDPRGFSPAARERLLAHSWPGNLIELRSVVEHARLRAEGTTIQPEHLPASLHHRPEETTPEPRLMTLAEQERHALLEAAALCQGRVQQMAERLGISRTTLWRRLKTLGIDPAHYRDHSASPKRSAAS
ncbi:dihydroxyacetone kinase operon transcriptional regulator DhaR [Aeromonas diversa]|uniref:dihydroxyacetone kinase operon transcriptional regulator DhaR n=1 Tax=Aeromonas diversa TaxID=502790 RepID=UPI0005B77BEA